MEIPIVHTNGEEVRVEWTSTGAECSQVISLSLSLLGAQMFTAALLAATELALHVPSDTTTDDMSPLGQRLRQLREQRHLSQQRIADRMDERGFHWLQSTVWKVEAGQRYVLFEEAVVLAEVLGVSLLDLADRRRKSAPTVGGCDDYCH